MASGFILRTRRFLLCTILGLIPGPLHAYSVLTHEAIIDDSWPSGIRPLLLKRFPRSTPDELLEAHAYAYGGAIIQDMGYYSLGSKFFSNLAHYVRSGDFILAMIRDSKDLDEYAFALGAAAHYAADNVGHPVAINRTVPMMYPKLEAEYGKSMTYEDNPSAHLKMEFAFDVVEVARGKYKPQAYHDFIGFKVSKPILNRAFQETYCMDLDQVFHNVDRALGTYRYAVSEVIPEMTKTAWSSKKDDIEKLEAGMTQQRFVYVFTRATYEKEWDRNYDRPGIGARLLAWILRIIPKVGPFKALAFRVPTPEAEKLFLASFDDTKQRYRSLLDGIAKDQPPFPNVNFDVGHVTRRGEYALADKTYDQLLEHLSDETRSVSKALRTDILRFYGASGEPSSEKARAALSALKTEPGS